MSRQTCEKLEPTVGSFNHFFLQALFFNNYTIIQHPKQWLDSRSVFGNRVKQEVFFGEQGQKHEKALKTPYS